MTRKGEENELLILKTKRAVIFGKNLFFMLGRRSAESFGIQERFCEIGVRRKRVNKSGEGGGTSDICRKFLDY